jgi:hypothetical protein
MKRIAVIAGLVTAMFALGAAHVSAGPLRGKWKQDYNGYTRCYPTTGVISEVLPQPIDDYYCKDTPLRGKWKIGYGGYTRCYPDTGVISEALPQPIDDYYCNSNPF